MYIPQERIRFWGLQSVKQRSGDRGFGSRVPDSVRDVRALDCRNWIWRPQVKTCLFWGVQCEIAAVFSMEHVSLRTDGDPSVLAASKRSNLCAGTCLFVHGWRSKCACGVRPQQCCRMNRSSCARREIQLAPGVRTQQFFRRNTSLCARTEIQACSQRAHAAVLSHEHVCLRTVGHLQLAFSPKV